MSVRNLNLQLSTITKSFNENPFLKLNVVQAFLTNSVSFRRGFAAVKKGKTEKQPTVDTSESNKMPTPKVIALPKPFPLLSYPRITKESLLQNSSYLFLSEDIESFMKKYKYPMDMGKYLSLVNENSCFLLREFVQNLVAQWNKIPNNRNQDEVGMENGTENCQLEKSGNEWSKSNQDSMKMVNSSANMFILDGINGIGKSVAMMQMVSLLNELNWITIYIPNSLYWIGGFFHYERSKVDPEMFDQFELASHFLQTIQDLNSRNLAKIHCSSDVCLPNLVPGSTLADLIEYSLKPENLQQSIKVVKILLEQLQLQTEFPVFFGIDQINAFFSATKYKTEESKILQPDNFTLLKQMIQFFNHGNGPFFRNGILLGATCYKVPKIIGDNNECIIDGLPNAHILEIPLMNKQETGLILEHYKEIGALYGSIDGSQLDKKFFLSGGVPENLFDCVVFDTVY